MLLNVDKISKKILNKSKGSKMDEGHKRGEILIGKGVNREAIVSHHEAEKLKNSYLSSLHIINILSCTLQSTYFSKDIL